MQKINLNLTKFRFDEHFDLRLTRKQPKKEGEFSAHFGAPITKAISFVLDLWKNQNASKKAIS